MVDPMSTWSPGPSTPSETRAERAAKEQLDLKEKALKRQADELARRAAPKAWWQEAFGAAANIKEAADAALEEANAKRAEELKRQKEESTAGFNPFKSARRESLFGELDRALDLGDFDKAAEVQRRIDAL